jgi:hypothetical protein
MVAVVRPASDSSWCAPPGEDGQSERSSLQTPRASDRRQRGQRSAEPSAGSGAPQREHFVPSGSLMGSASVEEGQGDQEVSSSLIRQISRKLTRHRSILRVPGSATLPEHAWFGRGNPDTQKLADFGAFPWVITRTSSPSVGFPKASEALHPRRNNSSRSKTGGQGGKRRDGRADNAGIWEEAREAPDDLDLPSGKKA